MWALVWRCRIERRLLSSSRQIPLRKTVGIASQGVEECRKQSQATTTENAPSRPYGLKDMSIHIPRKVIVIHIRHHKMRTQESTLTMSHSQSHQRLLRNLKKGNLPETLQTHHVFPAPNRGGDPKRRSLALSATSCPTRAHALAFGIWNSTGVRSVLAFTTYRRTKYVFSVCIWPLAMSRGLKIGGYVLSWRNLEPQSEAIL